MKHMTMVLFLIVGILINRSVDAVVIIDHMITKDPKFGSGCSTPIPTDTFYTSDEAVYSWVLWDDASKSDEIMFKWYNPNGDLTFENSTLTNLTSSCLSASILISGILPLNSSIGEWRVEVYFNGVEEFIEYFTLIESTSTSTISNTTTSSNQVKPCLIEQIYGELSEESSILRYFRDQQLTKTPEGKELISLYYQWSPILIKLMEEDGETQLGLRAIIDDILALIKNDDL